MKRFICIFLVLCLGIAFLGCQVQQGESSKAPDENLPVSSQTGQSSASQTQSSASSCPNNPLRSEDTPCNWGYSSDIYQTRENSLNTSTAFQNKEFTKILQEYSAPMLPMNAAIDVPMKALAPYSARGCKDFYSYMEAMVHFPACEGVYLDASIDTPGIVTLRMHTAYCMVRLREDLNQDAVEDIAQYVSFGAFWEGDLTEEFGRPAYLKVDAEPIEDAFLPVAADNVKQFQKEYYISYDKMSIQASAFIPNDENYTETAQAFEYILKNLTLGQVTEYFPSNFGDELLTMPVIDDPIEMPQQPDKGPVSVEVLVNQSGLNQKEQRVTLHIGNMEIFALYPQMEYESVVEMTAFDAQGKRIIVPYTDLVTIDDAKRPEPVVSFRVYTTAFEKDAQSGEELLKKLYLRGVMENYVNCSEKLGRTAVCDKRFVPGPYWRMMTDVAFVPEFATYSAQSYKMDFGKYYLSANICLPTTNHYRTGPLPQYLIAPFEEMLKSITLEEVES